MILSDQIARIRFRVYQILEADEPTPIATAIRVLIGILIVEHQIGLRGAPEHFQCYFSDCLHY
jgi:hypothetical protein